MGEWKDIIYAKRNTPYELRVKMPGETAGDLYHTYGSQFFRNDDGEWWSATHGVPLTPDPVQFREPEHPVKIVRRAA